MKHSNVIRLSAVVLFAVLWAIPLAHAVVHTSIFATIELSLKQPQAADSKTRLLSIAADGLVTIRLGDDTNFIARAGESFRDAKGHTPGTVLTLVSIDPAKDGVVIRYETRVYLPPPTPSPKKPK